MMWAVLFEKLPLADSEEETAVLLRVASLDDIKGMVEVWPLGSHKDDVWTDFNGEGYNTLGFLIYRMVEAIRLGFNPPLSTAATHFLCFDTSAVELKCLKLCKYMYKYA